MNGRDGRLKSSTTTDPSPMPPQLRHVPISRSAVEPPPFLVAGLIVQVPLNAKVCPAKCY